MTDSEQMQTQSQGTDLDIGISQSQPITPLWGRLYTKREGIQSFDLCNEEFAIGRADTNSVILKENELPYNILCRVSKVHFKITRENCELSNPVIIKDCSRNGTFLNERKIGYNEQRILQNDDVISLSHPNYKVYVFKDLAPNEGSAYPSTITNNYFVSKRLGSGACGTVSLVYDRVSCSEYAIKHVKKNMLAGTTKPKAVNDPNKVMNEAKIMKAIDHPCVVKLHDIIDTPDSVYMVIAYMKGGDLLSRILTKKRLSENISKLFFYQLCTAVKYLHDMGITHRDLKPDNILLNSSDEETLVKVSDFGLSKLVEKDTIMKTLCGTPLYVAPEILETKGHGAYSKKVDVWSLGVVLFTCLSGTLPFSDDYGTHASIQIKKGKFSFAHPSWKGITSKAKELIKQMLTVDPRVRPSIDEVFQHPWLQDPGIIRKAQDLMAEETGYHGPPCKKVRTF
ncbi:CHEK2 family protein [Megaselia abdita]